MRASVPNAGGKRFGALVADPKGIIDLPDGFSYRVPSRQDDMHHPGNAKCPNLIRVQCRRRMRKSSEHWAIAQRQDRILPIPFYQVSQGLWNCVLFPSMAFRGISAPDPSDLRPTSRSSAHEIGHAFQRKSGSQENRRNSLQVRALNCFSKKYSRRESNPYLRFRKPLFYPLNYGSFRGRFDSGFRRATQALTRG